MTIKIGRLLETKRESILENNDSIFMKANVPARKVTISLRRASGECIEVLLSRNELSRLRMQLSAVDDDFEGDNFF